MAFERAVGVVERAEEARHEEHRRRSRRNAGSHDERVAGSHQQRKTNAGSNHFMIIVVEVLECFLC